MASLSLTAKGVIGAFITSGVIHLVRPQVFEPTVPAALPSKKELVYASGAVELVCAAGLLVSRTRRLAGLASAGLLVAVLPANAQMAWDAHRAIVRKGSTPRREAMRAGTLARLPLQIPMIRAVLKTR